LSAFNERLFFSAEGAEAEAEIEQVCLATSQQKLIFFFSGHLVVFHSLQAKQTVDIGVMGPKRRIVCFQCIVINSLYTCSMGVHGGTVG
jgi:hypothetical protein